MSIDAYLVIKGTAAAGRIVAVEPTQAAATATAATDADYNAITGVVTVPSGRGVEDWYDGTDVLIEQPLSSLSEYDRLGLAAYEVHKYLKNLSEELKEIDTEFSQKSVGLIHNIVSFAHRGVRGVVLGSPPGTGGTTDSIWTYAERITFCEEMVKGPSNATTAADFLALTEGDDDILDPSKKKDDGMEYRVVWVVPGTGARVDLHEWATTSDDITTEMFADTNDPKDFIDAAWIGNL